MPAPTPIPTPMLVVTLARTDGRGVPAGTDRADGAWTASRPIRAAGTLLLARHQRRSVNDQLAGRIASDALKIGRASCRERVQSWLGARVAVTKQGYQRQ